MSLRVTIVDLKEAMCRWPLGDRTCDAQAVPSGERERKRDQRQPAAYELWDLRAGELGRLEDQNAHPEHRCQRNDAGDGEISLEP